MTKIVLTENNEWVYTSEENESDKSIASKLPEILKEGFNYTDGDYVNLQIFQVVGNSVEIEIDELKEDITEYFD